MAKLRLKIVDLKPATVKASTLLEVIVAMVIIMVVFLIATAIYTNVVSSSPSVKQQQGRAMAAGLIRQSMMEKDWADKTVELDSVVLQKVVEPYKEYADLLLITVVATERGKEIGRSSQVVRKEETHDEIE